MNAITPVAPHEIEERSFAIIAAEFFERTGLDPALIDPARFKIIQRVIHATGDFSFARSLCFHDRAIAAGMDAIRQGRDIYIDVRMGAAGISSAILKRYGGSVVCHVNDQEIAEKAQRSGKTRTETAVEKAAAINPGIIAVGNAPTALLAAMQMIETGRLTPALVIGVPVGFVNAQESKELLMQQPYPFVSNQGRKGGSPVAVAIVNALLRLLDSGLK